MAQVGQISNYSQLKIAVADFLDRNDLETVIPLFIDMAESEFSDKLRHHNMVKKVQTSVPADVGSIELPTDWLELRNVEVDDIQLVYQSPDQLDLRRNADPDETGQPCYFAFYGNTLEVWPVPTEAYVAEVDYYQKIPRLRSQQSGTNWLLDDHEMLYLYSAMAQAEVYLKFDERVRTWGPKAMELLASLQVSSERAMTMGSRLTRSPAVVI